ncbi:hypothetical protein SAMN02799630_03305 [Paenibacillus sp. UNCCL117]|uniref:hypothetical protein n=1 Tax=unclassified Paenibacillus TaxID=185978 RepID=UPI00089061D7|nr:MULTISPECIES: hypothetical protein [unclassified Paenibacillus]SDD72188.1 hypothetical protein SAMN04488602_112120 [Paenibacillus sp. cl123]SFW45679.1 hypothetical protein SAMN02799630_03305 [Paenibacillus sp. UNCCL117]
MEEKEHPITDVILEDYEDDDDDDDRWKPSGRAVAGCAHDRNGLAVRRSGTNGL